MSWFFHTNKVSITNHISRPSPGADQKGNQERAWLDEEPVEDHKYSSSPIFCGFCPSRYCTTFHCLWVRAWTDISYFPNAMYIGIYAIPIIRGPTTSTDQKNYWGDKCRIRIVNFVLSLEYSIRVKIDNFWSYFSTFYIAMCSIQQST